MPRGPERPFQMMDEAVALAPVATPAAPSAQAAHAPAGVAEDVATPVAVLGVAKAWGRPRRTVLDGVDLEVDPGEAVQIGGRNGAGKTTLLRLIAGMLAPDRGSVRVFALAPERDRRAYQRSVGWLPAGDRGLYARLTVRQHLRLWARLALIPRASRDPLMRGALQGFELEELADRRVDRLSMGQRQRVRLALTFLHEPRVVLLDEPRNSLDEEGVALLRDATDAVRARGGAVLCCAPGSDSAGIDASRALVLDDGGLRPA